MTFLTSIERSAVRSLPPFSEPHFTKGEQNTVGLCLTVFFGNRYAMQVLLKYASTEQCNCQAYSMPKYAEVCRSMPKCEGKPKHSFPSLRSRAFAVWNISPRNETTNALSWLRISRLQSERKANIFSIFCKVQHYLCQKF